jgi:uncharacterized protein
MKFALVLLVVVFGAWLWRRNRDADASQTTPPPTPTSAEPRLQDMVACAHCGVHLPQAEAIHGPRGWYCSPRHQTLHTPQTPGDA